MQNKKTKKSEEKRVTRVTEVLGILHLLRHILTFVNARELYGCSRVAKLWDGLPKAMDVVYWRLALRDVRRRRYDFDKRVVRREAAAEYEKLVLRQSKKKSNQRKQITPSTECVVCKQVLDYVDWHSFAYESRIARTLCFACKEKRSADEEDARVPDAKLCVRVHSAECMLVCATS